MVANRWLLLAGGLLCLFALLLVVGEADGFRLREHGQEEGLAVVKRKVAPRGKGDAPWSAVTRKPWPVKDDDDEDDEDEEEEDEEEEDEQETEEQAAIRRATQQRLLRARHGLKSRDKRPVAAASERRETVRGRGDAAAAAAAAADNDDDDEDEVAEAEPRSIFNLFGLLGSRQRTNSDDERRTIDDDDDDDDERETRQHTKEKQREPVRTARKGQEPADEASWLEGLKRALETVLKPAADDHAAKAEASDGGLLRWVQSFRADPDRKEQDNPIINLLASWLASADGGADSQEEIRFRPIGSYADDGEADADDGNAPPRQRGRPRTAPDSKLVQLLNHSPIASLFHPAELPAEPPVEAGPKRTKRSAADGPARVVKQRIAISPEDFEQLLLRVPSFVPDYTRVRGAECRRQGEIFERQLRGKRLWALQMIDASARLASGLLRGNANQLGDFDLCTGIATRVRVREDELVRLRGKYCLAHVDVVAEDAELRVPVHLLQGGGFVKSTLNDVSTPAGCECIPVPSFPTTV